ncbi:hypothetical protein B0H14DRAFT_3138319 [Mycena olivaceomarginata]|nr:hypothetical protein B0H14DRAFT_3138319 [Mycena olivaceomarginata]
MSLHCQLGTFFAGAALSTAGAETFRLRTTSMSENFQFQILKYGPENWLSSVICPDRQGGPIRRMAVDASHPSAVVRWMAVLIRRPPAASTGPKKFLLPVLFTTSIQQQPVDVG